MIRYERLAAPRGTGGILIEPPAAEVRAALRGASARTGSDARVFDRALRELRSALRQRLGLRAPVLLSGHQAEFFHAGVLAKNLALHHWRAAVGGSGVFLTVDTDPPRAADVPVLVPSPVGLHRVAVALPGVAPHLATGQQPPTPREHWLGFFTRLASLMGDYAGSHLRTFADAWLAQPEPLEFCAAFAAGRTAVEAALGATPFVELRVSQICDWPEFRTFVAWIVHEAPRFVAAYNAAQADFRRRHKVRNRARPVPQLLGDAMGGELPFWAARPGVPRRTLHFLQRADAVTLSAGAEPLATLARSALLEIAGGGAWPFEAAGWRLQPKALTLTAFVRLALSDLFIHGIGGAKYDEMTDAFAREFFGAAPAPCACVSATLYPPADPPPIEPAALGAARRAAADIRSNPQRYVRGADPQALRHRSELSELALRLARHEPHNHAARRHVFLEIKRINAQLISADPWRPAELDQQAKLIEQQRAQQQIAQDRELFFALHRRADLAALAESLRAGVLAQAE